MKTIRPNPFASLLLLVLLTAPAASFAAPSSLELAYQREHAFLLSERGALQRRLTEVDSAAAERSAAMQAEVDRLQGRLLGMAREADAADALLAGADRAGAAAQESSDLVASTLAQAYTSLNMASESSPQGEDAVTAEQLATRLGAAFAVAGERVEQGRSVRSGEGSFFLADGTQVAGTLISVGSIATYGVSDAGSGALAPLGEGRLALRNPEAAADAKALLAGAAPATLGIFLHESLQQAAPPEKVRTLRDLMTDGGTIGWIIVVLGALGLLGALGRTVSIGRVARGAASTVEEVTRLITAGSLDEAVLRCRRGGGAVGEVLGTLLSNRDRSRAAMEDLLAEGLLRIEPQVKRFGAELRVVAAVAPLLGLLGTVTGMIATFEVITQFGTGDPKMLSGGISAALVTTQLGLVVAIPMLLIGNVLSAWGDGVLTTLEEGALRMLNVVRAVTGAQPPSADKPEPVGPPPAIARAVAEVDEAGPPILSREASALGIVTQGGLGV